MVKLHLRFRRVLWARHEPLGSLHVPGTLFFAGEATHTAGMNGTTAGALESANRACVEIEAAL